jgi:hypothetical protein
MESSILSEVDDTSILRTGLPRRYGCPLNWLPTSHLLPPRSGLERSDFVLWHIADSLVPARYGRLSGVGPPLPERRAPASWVSFAKGGTLDVDGEFAARADLQQERPTTIVLDMVSNDSLTCGEHEGAPITASSVAPVITP